MFIFWKGTKKDDAIIVHFLGCRKTEDDIIILTATDLFCAIQKNGWWTTFSSDHMIFIENWQKRMYDIINTIMYILICHPNLDNILYCVSAISVLFWYQVDIILLSTFWHVEKMDDDIIFFECHHPFLCCSKKWTMDYFLQSR